MRCLGVLLGLLLVTAGARASGARGQLERLVHGASLGGVFDGGKTTAAAGPEAAPRAPSADASSSPLVPDLRDPRALEQAKDILSGDTGSAPSAVHPFVFHPKDGDLVTAADAGLEGFVWTERNLARQRGREALVQHVNDDYAQYLTSLLAPVAWSAEARRRIREINGGPGSDLERYGRLIDFVRGFTEQLRAAVAAADKAAWVRRARIYELFARAYNLEGRRGAAGPKRGRFFADFATRDLKDIRDMGFDTVWVMGIYPIGKRGAGGTGGGSPYSIQDHESVNPELGTPEDFKAFVERAHRLGLKVILDYVVNHTSMDSKLLEENPEYFLHRPAGDGAPPTGYFEHTDPLTGDPLWIRHGGYDSYGSLAFWEDTAQLDYSNVRLRRRVIQIAEKWVRDYGIDGFRADVAYQLLNRYFGRNWGLPMPKREFLEELTTEIKSKYPGTAFIAEAYDGWDELSRCGFDLIYGKNDMSREGGHAGWYDSLVSRDPARIRSAIKRTAFLDWQEGGAGMLAFTGNHDEIGPRRAFGPWAEGATFLTLLQPGAVLFYGSQEIGFDRPAPDEPKPLPFSVPVQVDWSKPDPKIKAFHDETFRLAREVRALLGASDAAALASDGDEPWVGYLLLPRSPSALKAAAVVANPSDRETDVRFSDPERGLEYHGTLPPFGYRLIRF